MTYPKAVGRAEGCGILSHTADSALVLSLQWRCKGELGMKRKSWSLLLLLLSLALAVQAMGLERGELAPPLQAVTLAGHHEDSRNWSGRVVLIAFVASWCSPCRRELPILAQYAARHRQHFKLVIVAMDDADDLADLQGWMRGLSLDPALASSTQADGYGRIWRLPVSFVIGRDGRLVDNGWDDAQPAWTRARLHTEITPLLSGS